MNKQTLIFLLLLCITSIYLFSGKQVALKNDRWQLIGMNGLYVEGLSPPVWGSNGFILENTINSDGNLSYGVKETIRTGVDEFNPFGATIGLSGLVDSFSPTGATQLSLGVNVAIEKTDFNDFVSLRTKYRMYLAGRDNAPAIRIDYQSDLEGEVFRVRFGNENIHYNAYFDNTSTFSSPQILTPGRLNINNNIQRIKIMSVVDSNLSDNNLTKLISNTLGDEINSSIFTDGGFATRDGNFTVYKFSNKGVWEQFDSKNTASSNQFDEFDLAQGYWMKMTSKNYDENLSYHGLIIGDGGVSDNSYSSLRNDWNLLSFRDTNIRYSPSAMFIPSGDFSGSAIHLSYKFQIDSFEIDSLTPFNASRRINWEVQRLRITKGSVFNMKAFPAQRSIDGTTLSEGIVIISDDLFETDSPNAISLTGEPLRNTVYGTRSTYFGDFLLGVQVGDLNGSGINQTFKVSMPLYNPKEISISELNDSIISSKANKIRLGMIEAGDNPASLINDAKTGVYIVNIDMDTANTYDIHLLASSGRFAIFDNTYTKVFKKIDDGPFVIKGMISENAKNINDINILSSSTKVSYIDLNNNQFAIVSNEAQSLDLLESAGYTLFEDNQKIEDVSKQPLGVGAIGKVYTHKNILNATFKVENYDNVLDANEGIINPPVAFFDDLRGASMWSPDFPNDGPINVFSRFNKSIIGILTMDSSNVGGSEDFWSITDTTKDPARWFEKGDSQQLFNIKKEKAYWVNIKESLPTAISINKDVLYKVSSSPHFDNNLTMTSNQGVIGLVTNHINHDFSISIDGIDPKTNDSYNIFATIAGQSYPLRTIGNRFSLRINDWDMSLKESIKGKTPPDVIILNVFDGLGNSLINKDNKVIFTKPDAPSIDWDNGVLKITSDTTYEIHGKPILDSAIKESVLIDNSNILKSVSDLQWKKTKGEITILRVVSKGETPVFYSNMKPVIYAPVNTAHVLNTESTGDSDVIPYSYISGGVLKVNGIERDNGVGLTNLSTNRILMSYSPNEIKEGIQQLASFSGADTMYLRIGIKVIGLITYIPSFKDKIFYIYYESNLYQGKFSDDSTYSYAQAAYRLDSGTINYDPSQLGNQGNKIDHLGYTTTSQQIVEPKQLTAPIGGGGNKPPSPQLLLPRK